MAYSLMTLPNELVAFIWSLLPIDEAAQGRMICRRICSLMDQSEIFWNSFLHLALKHRMMSRIDAAGKLRCTEVYHEGALELVGDSLKPATPFFTKEYSMNPNLLAIRSESSSVGYRRGISLTKQFMCNLMQIIQGYHTRDDIFPDSEAIAVLLAPPVDHPTVFDCPWCNEALYANKRFALDVWASLRVRVLFVSPMHDEPIVTAQKELASQDLQQNVTEKKMWLECRRCGTIGACSPICLQCRSSTSLGGCGNCGYMCLCVSCAESNVSKRNDPPKCSICKRGDGFCSPSCAREFGSRQCHHCRRHFCFRCSPKHHH